MLFSELLCSSESSNLARRGGIGAFGVAGNRLCLDQQVEQALTRTTLGFTACPFVKLSSAFLSPLCLL